MPLFLLDMLEDPDDREAFEIIYKQYEQLLFYVANNMLHDEGLAEDAVIETFTRLAKNFDKTNKKVCLRMKSFLVIIDRNICINMIRKADKSIPSDPDELDERYSISDESDTHAILEELKSKILTLPKTYCDTLYLTYIEQLSVKEIAILLDINEDAVYKRIKRGRALLLRGYSND